MYVPLYKKNLVHSCVVVKKNRGKKLAIFRQTAANFRQRRLWVLEISIAHIFPKNGRFSAPNIVF